MPHQPLSTFLHLPRRPAGSLLPPHIHQRRTNKNQDQNQNHDNQDQPLDLGCSCFICYKSFWARWDSLPNRHIIHTILDAFEEEETALRCSKKDDRGKSKKKAMKMKKKEEEEEEAVVVVQEIDHAHHENDDGHGDGEEEGDEKSSVREFFWFLKEITEGNSNQIIKITSSNYYNQNSMVSQWAFNSTVNVLMQRARPGL